MSVKCLNVILAQTGTAAAGSQTGGPPPILQLVPMILMFVALYVVMFALPQSKKNKAHANLLSSLKTGDKIVTGSGIVGIVVSVKEKTVAIRSADTKMEVLKSSVSEITERSAESNASEAKSES